MNVRRVAATLVMVALLITPVGCAQDPAPEADPESPQTSEPGTGSAQPGPETPDPNGGTPSVSLPGLPVGGDPQISTEDPAVECAQVNWIVDEGSGAELDEGIAVTIDSVTPSPEYFGLADSGCTSLGPSCVGYAFDAANETCYVAVTLVGEAPEFPDEGEQLTASGSATCASQEQCDAFAAAVAESEQIAASLDSSLLTSTE